MRWLFTCLAGAALVLPGIAYAQVPGDLRRWNNGTNPYSAGPFVAADIGYEWWLALRADGTLASFGTTPPTPAPAGPFIALSVGLNQLQWAVLLRPDGSGAYWGLNIPCCGLQDIPPGPLAAVSAGAWHGVALRTDGTVAQWGSAAAGTPPPGVFTAISAGQDFSLALRPDGTIAAWGDDHGYGMLTPPEGSFLAIAAGSQHALAIRLDGTLVGWGRPIYSSVVPGTFVAIDAGQFSAARRSDGTVALFGSNGPNYTFGGYYSSVAAGVVYGLAIVGCYADCDQSTTAPTLNVADFTCFLQRFAGAEPYANCDGSTTAPVLNVADFTCFLQKFAAGCS